ncbi:MAG: hypothetical protein AAGJ86_08830 [Pseudomonadota bacterium]
MQSFRMMLSAIGVSTLLATSATADEYWAACDGCGDSARQFAIGVPAEQFGESTVNVYDNIDSRLRTYRVTIYYDYEFRAWSRFARETPPGTAALAMVDSVKQARTELTGIAESSGAVVVDIADVQSFLLGQGRYDRTIADALFDAWRLNGFVERVQNAFIALSSSAARVVGNDSLNPQFQIVFEDGSTALVTTSYLANADGRTEIHFVDDSARLPDGTRLPDSPSDFDDYVVGTNDYRTIAALNLWARSMAGLNISVQSGVGIGSDNVTYIFRCDETECVLTAIQDRD